MNTTPFFLAHRIALKSMYAKSISTMTIICFFGIFIGSFSLALITAITNGYEHTIHEKMQGIHAQIIVRAAGSPLNLKAVEPVLRADFPEIESFSPTTIRHILIRADDDTSMPSVALIKGINPAQEINTSTLARKIILPVISPQKSRTLSDYIHADHIIIGKQMAREHAVHLGDTLELLFNNDEQMRGRKVTFETKKVIIGGIFETGIDEFDSGVIYCTLSFLKTIFPDTAVEQINIRFKPDTYETTAIEKLKKRLGLDVYSWKELYPALVAALKLEKYVTFFILALITLVASMNIISLLYMHITHKRSDIALLSAMGMRPTAISAIFFSIGITISVFATVAGLCAAVLACWFLQHYPFITLPDAYFVTTLPVRMEFFILASVFCIVLFFTIFATWLSCRRIRSMNISQILRFER